jgi:radical SAM superfamily enzyme YgiQ (UPF0313 family)
MKPSPRVHAGSLSRPSVLLVNTTDARDLLVYPIGLDYIASVLSRQAAADVVGLDLALSGETSMEEQLRGALSAEDFEVIGFNLRNLCDQTIKRVEYVPLLRSLVGATRRALLARGKTSIIAVGGAGASLAPSTILREVDADVLISGDGEAGFLELLRRLDTGDAPRGIIVAETDITEIAYARGTFGDITQYAARKADGNLQTRRGCSFACDYCSYPVIEGRSVRMREPEIVAEEMLQLERFGFKKVFIVDAIFNSPLKHAKRVLRAFAEAKTKAEWTGFFSPKYIDREILELIKETHGGNPLKLTIESGSDEMLKSLAKGFDKSEIIAATELCREAGVPFSFTVLFGGPGESEATVAESIELITSAKPEYLSASIGVYVYPQTPLAKRTVGRIWNNEEELMGKTIVPVDREAVKKQLESGLAGSPFPIYIH